MRNAGQHVFIVEAKDEKAELKDLPRDPYVRFEGRKNVLAARGDGEKTTETEVKRWNLIVKGTHKNKPDMIERFVRRGDMIVGYGNFPLDDKEIAKHHGGENPYRALQAKIHFLANGANSHVAQERDELQKRVQELEAKVNEQRGTKATRGSKAQSQGEVPAAA